MLIDFRVFFCYTGFVVVKFSLTIYYLLGAEDFSS